jgi:hypothetical protein
MVLVDCVFLVMVLGGVILWLGWMLGVSVFIVFWWRMV